MLQDSGNHSSKPSEQLNFADSAAVPGSDIDTLLSNATLALYGRNYDAVADVSRAIVLLRPREARAWYLLAVAEEKRGDENQALHCYEQCLRYDAQNVAAALALAHLQHRQGKINEAATLINRILDADLAGKPDILAAAENLWRKLRHKQGE